MTQEKSLAERLGYARSDRLLIINCDDFGSSHAANVAIERSLKLGIASSTTLMVPCPWAREAAVLAEELEVGVHLTLTAEYPGYRWRSLTNARSLHDKDGFFPRTAQEVWAKADPSDAEAECRAQITQALGWGIDVTHLDAHMGTLQVDPRYFAIYVTLAREFRLPLRMVNSSHERQMGFACREPALRDGVVFPDNFIAPRWGIPARDTLLATIGSLLEGVSEIFLHPVEDGPELRGYDLENASLRAADFACLINDDVRAEAAKFKLKTISFRPLRELMRGAQQSVHIGECG